MKDKNVVCSGVEPYIPAFIGIGLIGINMLINGTFSPFAIATIIIMVMFEYIFRKTKYICAWICPVVISCAIVYVIKHGLVDFKVMNTSSQYPTIAKGARVVFQPALYKLRKDNLIIYTNDKDRKYYVGRIINQSADSMNILYGEKSIYRIANRQVVGKIIYILNP